VGVGCRGDPCEKRPGAAPMLDRASSSQVQNGPTTEPISDAGGASVKTHLRRGKKHCSTATIERSEGKEQEKQPWSHQGQ